MGDLEKAVEIIVNRRMAGAGWIDSPVVDGVRRQARRIVFELLQSGLMVMVDPAEQLRGLRNPLD